MLAIERIRERIAGLDESEAKSLLMIIYSRLDTAVRGSGGQEALEEALRDLLDTFERLPDRGGK